MAERAIPGGRSRMTCAWRPPRGNRIGALHGPEMHMTMPEDSTGERQVPKGAGLIGQRGLAPHNHPR
jgi:hypothetical protein